MQDRVAETTQTYDNAKLQKRTFENHNKITDKEY